MAYSGVVGRGVWYVWRVCGDENGWVTETLEVGVGMQAAGGGAATV